MSLDPRDAALLASCPCVPVPRFGELEPMGFGQRALVGSNGAFLQVRRSWLDCVVKLAALPSAPPLPYGVVQERIEFGFGVIPIALLEEFIAQGRDALPNEIAGGLIFNVRSRGLQLLVHDAIESAPGRVRYRIPELGPDEVLAVDLHTHGRLPAFWSSTDDADDQGVKVCGVFGSLHLETPSAAFRLAVNGHYKALPHPWQAAASRPARCAADLDLDDACPTLVSMGFAEVTGPWNI